MSVRKTTCHVLDIFNREQGQKTDLNAPKTGCNESTENSFVRKRLPVQSPLISTCLAPTILTMDHYADYARAK